MSSRMNLPRAYLRMSPNLDQHPDPGGMVLLLCAANRQPRRGRFRDKATLVRALGGARFRRLVARGDIVVGDDGWFYVEGWDVWQEGDLTVAERQARIRENRVTRSRSSNGDVTPPALLDRDSLSEATGDRRKGDTEGERDVAVENNGRTPKAPLTLLETRT